MSDANTSLDDPTADLPASHFDKLFHGDPVNIERGLQALRERARQHDDLSLAPQIESLIALAQAMQRRFDEAFSTLDAAKRLPGANAPVACVRLLIERGCVLRQARRMHEARGVLIAAYERSRAQAFDVHTINAAHMVAAEIRVFLAFRQLTREETFRANGNRTRTPLSPHEGF